MSNPAKLLQVYLGPASVLEYNPSAPSKASAWSVEIDIVRQSYYDNGTKTYDANSVHFGDYVITKGSGVALRIRSITAVLSSTKVLCILEDDGYINSKLDPNGNSSTTFETDGYLFEVVDDLPVIYPLPSVLFGNFTPTFAVQLLNRFESIKRPFITKSSLNVPNGIPQLDSNGKLPVNTIPGGSVTKESLGLGNIDNTSDLSKPISNSVQAALNAKINTTQLDVNGGPIPTLDTGKVKFTQLPVGSNPVTSVAPGGDYLSAGLLGSKSGTGVAKLVNGLIPEEYIPASSANFITVSTYADLIALSTKSTTKYYIVSNGAEAGVYVWSGVEFLSISASTADSPYSYYTLTTNNEVWNALNKQIISVNATGVIIVLPLKLNGNPPDNGTEIVILNNSSHEIKLNPQGQTINNSNIPNGSYYTIASTTLNVYLVYVNGWQFSNANQLVNIYTQKPGADQYGPADYWPTGVTQTLRDQVVFGKNAIVETWTSSVSTIVPIISYQQIGEDNRVVATVSTTDGWAVGDTIKISGAVGTSTRSIAMLNNIDWTIESIVSLTTFAFYITAGLVFPYNDGLPFTTRLGVAVRKKNEDLAQEITIFDPEPSDNFRSIWFPKSGIALQRDVKFDSNFMPTTKYSNNLVVTLGSIMGLTDTWKTYETFDFMATNNNGEMFTNIINDQKLLDIISSNTDFLTQFVSCNTSKLYTNPDMKSNILDSVSPPSGCIVGGSSRWNNTTTNDYWYAFDSSLTTQWVSLANSVTNQYLNLTLPASVALFPSSFTIYTSSLETSPKSVVLQYSINGGVTYEELATFKLNNDTIEDTFFVLNAFMASQHPRYWRFFFPDCYSTGPTPTMSVTSIKLRGWNLLA